MIILGVISFIVSALIGYSIALHIIMRKEMEKTMEIIMSGPLYNHIKTDLTANKKKTK